MCDNSFEMMCDIDFRIFELMLLFPATHLLNIFLSFCFICSVQKKSVCYAILRVFL